MTIEEYPESEDYESEELDCKRQRFEELSEESESEQYDSSSSEYSDSSYCEGKVMTAIVKWIVCADLPLTIVECPTLTRLFDLSERDIILPTTEELVEMLKADFAYKKRALLLFVRNNQSKFALSVHSWTTGENMAFVNITCHFINEDWTMYSLMLECLPAFYYESEAKELCQTALDTYGLSSNVTSVVFDSDASNDNIVFALNQDEDSPFSGPFHTQCLAHVITSAAENCFKIIEKDLNSLRCFICSYERCPKSSARLEDESMPLLDHPMQWMTTLSMLKKSLLIKSEIIDILGQGMEDYRKVSIGPEDWEKLEEIHDYLKPFEQVALALCADDYPTLGLVIPSCNYILHHLKSVIRGSNKLVADHAEQVKMEIEKYYNLTGNHHRIATFLDPRFKLNHFKKAARQAIGSETVDDILEITNRHYESLFVPECPALQKQIDNTFSDIGTRFQDLFDFDDNPDLRDEFAEYCGANNILGKSGTTIPTGKDVLIWWKKHESLYPNLAKMARDFLCIPATSAPSEKLFYPFSINSHFSQDDDTIQMLQLLKSWYGLPYA